jgi:hypothetical protein
MPIDSKQAAELLAQGKISPDTYDRIINNVQVGPPAPPPRNIIIPSYTPESSGRAALDATADEDPVEWVSGKEARAVIRDRNIIKSQQRDEQQRNEALDRRRNFEEEQATRRWKSKNDENAEARFKGKPLPYPDLQPPSARALAREQGARSPIPEADTTVKATGGMVELPNPGTPAGKQTQPFRPSSTGGGGGAKAPSLPSGVQANFDQYKKRTLEANESLLEAELDQKLKVQEAAQRGAERGAERAATAL